MEIKTIYMVLRWNFLILILGFNIMLITYELDF